MPQAQSEANTKKTTPSMRGDHVPFNGDVAHRRGFALIDNPYPEHKPQHRLWEQDWRFRHAFAWPTAPDAPGGRMYPTETCRANGVPER